MSVAGCGDVLSKIQFIFVFLCFSDYGTCRYVQLSSASLDGITVWYGARRLNPTAENFTLTTTTGDHLLPAKKNIVGIFFIVSSFITDEASVSFTLNC